MLVTMVGIRFTTIALAVSALMTCACLSGCQGNPWSQWNETIKGNGFPAWNSALGEGARGSNPEAKPSGFFTDRRSEQIEQNLGGGF
jgi:hypothetical protein